MAKRKTTKKPTKTRGASSSIDPCFHIVSAAQTGGFFFIYTKPIFSILKELYSQILSIFVFYSGEIPRAAYRG